MHIDFTCLHSCSVPESVPESTVFRDLRVASNIALLPSYYSHELFFRFFVTSFFKSREHLTNWNKSVQRLSEIIFELSSAEFGLG